MLSEESFLQCLNRHRGILLKVSRIYADRPEDRRDLQQEITYQLWKAYPTYRGDSPFSTWMYRVALNTALGGYRRRTLRLFFPDKLPDAPDTGTEDPSLTRLFAAIRQLPRSDRALLALYLDDLSLSEIGEVLGITANNAGVKLHRAKAKLKIILNPPS
ncbi:RNA polymerase sigma-70 factor (ECF subfamily) [Neolewinella xylanilytica]|uniref:RNA polymerase sigma-70 factor (ECF subfamily) n=1 Tax=Neolewinella xylanilytica TaxID=1514080 RepID=A0A2S6I395_9BACT|nr:sigma-70 family RNA polymerase sigma factor [Neolewinella xylanilytica]PPK85647.1 RNA polymerase sigma-70 factor (ECF subfamily) [Neolewinella xylanilytica]